MWPGQHEAQQTPLSITDDPNSQFNQYAGAAAPALAPPTQQHPSHHHQLLQPSPHQQQQQWGLDSSSLQLPGAGQQPPLIYQQRSARPGSWRAGGGSTALPTPSLPQNQQPHRPFFHHASHTPPQFQQHQQHPYSALVMPAYGVRPGPPPPRSPAAGPAALPTAAASSLAYGTETLGWGGQSLPGEREKHTTLVGWLVGCLTSISVLHTHLCPTLTPTGTPTLQAEAVAASCPPSREGEALAGTEGATDKALLMTGETRCVCRPRICLDQSAVLLPCLRVCVLCLHV